MVRSVFLVLQRVGLLCSAAIKAGIRTEFQSILILLRSGMEWNMEWKYQRIPKGTGFQSDMPGEKQGPNAGDCMVHRRGRGYSSACLLLQCVCADTHASPDETRNHRYRWNDGVSYVTCCNGGVLVPRLSTCSITPGCTSAC